MGLVLLLVVLTVAASTQIAAAIPFIPIATVVGPVAVLLYVMVMFIGTGVAVVAVTFTVTIQIRVALAFNVAQIL